MKTAKYYMEVWIGDNILSTCVELTKKSYNEQKIKLDKQFIENSDTTQDFYVERDEFTREGEHTKKSVIVYACGINDIRLVKYQCDDGYCFANK